MTAVLRALSEKAEQTTASRRKRSKRPRAVIPARRPLTFRQYENVVKKTDERRSRLVSLLGLVGEIGDLHSMVKKLLLQRENQTFRKQLAEEFGDILWYLTSLALLYKIPLSEVAETNARKAQALFTSGTRTKFDKGYPSDERLPRQFRVSFKESTRRGSVHVKIYVNGVAVGDSLTDNAAKDDGYRYHDVFHLAFAAVLGWSPVTRALLKVKRKSQAKIDEVEDGARAIIVEEGVSAFLFNQAEEHGWYQEIASIDVGLLKMVRQLTSGLEVSTCTAKQWREAIHQGFSVFEQLIENKGGSVNVDLDAQAISYLKPKRPT